MKEKFIEFSIHAFLIFCTIYLYSNLLVTYGVVKERANKECVSPQAMNNWEETLDTARAICVESQDNHMTDISNAYKDQITKLEGEAKYWKDAYLWLKKQVVEED